MEVVVYYPETEGGWKALEERVSEVHAKIIVDYVSRLGCSAEDKRKIIEDIIQLCKKRETKIAGDRHESVVHNICL